MDNSKIFMILLVIVGMILMVLRAGHYTAGAAELTPPYAVQTSLDNTDKI